MPLRQINVRTVLFIDTNPDLAPSPTCLDQLHDQRARSEFFAQGAVQVLQYRQPRVPSRQVTKFQRPHWMIQSEAQRRIDVLGARGALHQTYTWPRCRAAPTCGWSSVR